MLKKREKYDKFILGENMKKKSMENKKLSKMDKIKKFFKNKYVIIGTVVLVVIILVVSIVLIVKTRKKEIFSLNSIFSVYPEEVRALYSNMVEVSCYGDLHFDISVEDGEVSIDKLGKNYLIDYALSHVDKKYGLNVKHTRSSINKNINSLIAEDLNLIDNIKDYKYGNYTYNFEDDMLVREKSECSSDVKYVSFLFGYSYGTKVLSVDINIGYLKNGILYDMNDKKLGKYDGDMEELRKLYIGVPYYRYNFVKSNGDYKLNSVSLNARTSIKR